MYNAYKAQESMTPQPRQRPGSACEECRRRKLRCDGKQPQCQHCSESGVQCITIHSRSQRGPKRGHMKALQTRMATLEQRLLEQQQKGPVLSLPGADLPCSNALEIYSMDSAVDIDPSLTLSNLPDHTLVNLTDPLSENYQLDVSLGTITPESLDSSVGIHLSSLLRTDLDQSYFERSHPFVPILHQRQYFSWSKLPIKTESQMCLQYAMWTLAASLSAPLQYLRDSLYDCTRTMLDSLESKDSHADFTTIEHLQARVLILIYDFMRFSHQRGWMSAGRCFRLLQLMRLYELDSPDNVATRNSAVEPESWIKTEEKRRTFWVAYSLDRFISIRNEWPLTLSEQVISTRLPVPEEKFQSSQNVEMGFLSEAITSVVDQSTCSPLTESIILATICGRAIAHRQQSAVEHIYCNVPQHFWDRHEWLDTMLKTRADILLLNYPSMSTHADCLLLFTNMVAQTTVLYLCKIMESMTWQTEEYRIAMMEFKQRSLVAAQEIVNLTRSLAHLSYLKVHPFTPLPLLICAEFLTTHRYLDESVDVQVQGVLEVLKDLSSVNNIAQEYSSLQDLENVEIPREYL